MSLSQSVHEPEPTSSFGVDARTFGAVVNSR
jgi:hypothetical protein